MSEDKVRSFQDKLYHAAKSDPKRRFHSLRDKVIRTDILKRAWADVEKNKGAPGPDGKTIEEIKEAGVDKLLVELQQELRDKTYHPGPVLRVYITKPTGGIRPLGIPNVRDRVAQAAVKIVIEPIFEADFLPFSFGYRPGKSAKDASEEIYKWLNFGFENVLDADIEHCFDEIPHDRLMEVLANRILDGYILKLIKMWLCSPVLSEGTLYKTKKGTPQGGVISPLLANVYLHQLDAEWVKRGMTKRSGPNAQMVRYADDIVILTKKSLDRPLNVLHQILDELGLKLSEEKTDLTKAENGFDFLGFRFIRQFSKKYGKRKSYFYPSEESVKRVKAKICKIANSHNLHILPEEVVKSLNSLINGWQEYYRHSNAGERFSDVQRYTMLRFRRFLRRRKGKSGIGKYRDFPDEDLIEKFGFDIKRNATITYR